MPDKDTLTEAQIDAFMESLRHPSREEIEEIEEMLRIGQEPGACGLFDVARAADRTARMRAQGEDVVELEAAKAAIDDEKAVAAKKAKFP